MESRRPLQLLLLLFAVISLCMLPAVAGAGDDTKITCIERERQALLKIKDDFVDNYGILSSWGSEDENRDCCKWTGIGCNNRTGHVTILDLQGSDYPEEYEYLEGKISRSLLELQNLNYLDLSYNNFRSSSIPDFIGSLGKLEYLDLSYSNFNGTLPYQLGNLSSLRTLYISCDPILFYDSRLKNVDKLEWLSNLSSLTHLDMSRVNLSEAIDWSQTINMLPSLTHLYLSECNLPTIISPSLSLKNSSTSSLAFLDLSWNSLNSSIYQWLFNFSNSLVDLDLSDNQLQGPIPEVFGNLISLTSLDLSNNQLQGPIPEAFGNLSSLAHVALMSNQLEGGIPNNFKNMCSLQELYLGWNSLTGELSEFVQNLSGCLNDSLEILALDGNKIRGSLPDFSRFSALSHLSLNENQLNGSLPKCFPFPSKLVALDLQQNYLTGPLPESYIKSFSSISALYLAGNQLNGTLPESLGLLSTLRGLDISSNSFHGTITKTHLLNLPNLTVLDLSFNSLNLELSFDWVPKFQLHVVGMSSCKLAGGRFPLWLRTQKELSFINIFNAGISDFIPNWFWTFSPNMYSLNLSSNSLKGKLQNITPKLSVIGEIDLSDNHFEGALPPLLFSNTTSLNLSKNNFSGSISFLCAMTNKDMIYLDLSYNQLAGGLPNCWQNWENLLVLVLANNNLSRKIPHSIGSLYQIQSLHLQNNSLSGVLPTTLGNCTNLRFVDLGGNRFSGNMPSWIGESLSSLVVLRLRSNLFNGNIPLQFCHLQSIQILDLSANNISGSIPGCLQNLTAISHKGFFNETDHHVILKNSIFFAKYVDNFLVVWKGREFEYERTLNLLKVIDLSSNRLSGEIPIEITNLYEILALNLSNNKLVGLIPQNIGQLKMLESLDLSRNRLSGGLPMSLSVLSFLSHLDLSNNNLSGRIPSSTQLQSFNASAYMGNDGLCGLPLPNKCPGDEEAHVPPIPGGSKDNTQEDKQGLITTGFYTSMGVGFATGFWGVCGSLLLNRSWRYAFFRFLNDVGDRFYVLVAVRLARIQRRLQN